MKGLRPEVLRPAAFRYGVVEDEPVARRVLLRALERLAPDAACAWEAEDGDTALQRMAQDPVDVLFLDIVFPPDGAFAMLERLRAREDRLPRIVFVTSQEDQALRAFEWAACDFLVKPLSLPRVGETLARLRQVHAEADLGTVLRAVKDLGHRTGAERFTVTVKDRILVFRWSEVLYLHTEFRQVFAHTARGKVPLDQGMDALEALLGERFARIHRSSLVNLDALVEVSNPPDRAGEAVMQDGARLRVSRARMDQLLRRLQRIS
jgi:two-component system LytT family response regulator